ncbi:phage tail protein I [Yersinia enterocolitica]|uniref:phage tail protein I n=1 Tax=Yersinia enterocolitica TaxID=630 RepID=UPI00398CB3C8
MTDRLLPVGSSVLEVAAARACAELENTPVPIRQLWNADTCPLELLPYLAWAWSVDRWDESWPETTKRAVVKSSAYLHKHKGTIGALRRVVEPLGYLIRVTEWWKTNEPPGTFRLDVGVLETGITEEMYPELERLIDDAKPCSRHLNGLSINLAVNGAIPINAASYDSDEMTIYPYEWTQYDE